MYDPSQVGIQLHVEETGQDLSLLAGEALNYTLPSGYDQLHITPTFYLQSAEFVNNTDLQVSPSVRVKALEACLAFDIWLDDIEGCLGPVIDKTWEGPHGAIDLYDKTFYLPFNSVQGQEFVLRVGDQPGPGPIPEPATLALVVSGLGATVMRGWWRRRKN